MMNEVSADQPRTDRVGAIETNGINAISDEERHGAPLELFWIWFAANVGVLGIVYGAVLAAAGLNLWQSVVVTLVGTVGSFALVGVLSLAGVWGGAPMLTLSRAAFGPRGNLGPTLISWISLVGWETVLVIISAYALLGLLNLARIPTTAASTVISLIVIAALVVVSGLLGHATLVLIQQVATWLFGLLTLVIVVFLFAKTDWTVVLRARPGPWDSGVLAMLSVIAAGTGIGWVNSGADYTRYLPRRHSGRAIVGWTVFGGTLPLFVLVLVGFLLSSRVANLASAGNPIAVIGAALPSWMSIPYLLTAIGGLVVASSLDIYSSGLNLLALGLKVKRYQSVFVDGVIMVLGAIYVMLVAKDFLGPFQSFLQLLADGLMAWSAVFLVDMLRRRVYDAEGLADTRPRGPYFYRDGFHVPAVAAWLAGIVVSLLFTASPFFTGPFARGIFASSSLGYFLGFIVSAVLYAVLARSSSARPVSTAASGAAR